MLTDKDVTEKDKDYYFFAFLRMHFFNKKKLYFQTIKTRGDLNFNRTF